VADAWAAELAAEHEAALAALTDEQWFVSRKDLVEYQARVPGARARFVPPAISRQLCQARIERFLAADSAGGDASPEMAVGIAGRYDFEPNRASLEWLVKRLAPELKKRGFAGIIDVVGQGVPEALARECREYPFMRVHGFVEDLEPFWQSWSYMLVPHVCGSGTRIKLLESLGGAVPVIANAEALEPLEPALSRLALARELSDPRGWAEILTGRKPFEDRRAQSAQGFPAALDGQSIYGFLSELS
jgi:hypothetical protein